MSYSVGDSCHPQKLRLLGILDPFHVNVPIRCRDLYRTYQYLLISTFSSTFFWFSMSFCYSVTSVNYISTQISFPLLGIILCQLQYPHVFCQVMVNNQKSSPINPGSGSGFKLSQEFNVVVRLGDFLFVFLILTSRYDVEHFTLKATVCLKSVAWAQK